MARFYGKVASLNKSNYTREELKGSRRQWKIGTSRCLGRTGRRKQCCSA